VRFNLIIQKINRIEKNNMKNNTCNDKCCYFNSNNICQKEGKCLKEIDNTQYIKKTCIEYWENLRRKYHMS
jgi:hypothetical protein